MPTKIESQISTISSPNLSDDCKQSRNQNATLKDFFVTKTLNNLNNQDASRNNKKPALFRLSFPSGKETKNAQNTREPDLVRSKSESCISIPRVVSDARRTVYRRSLSRDYLPDEIVYKSALFDELIAYQAIRGPVPKRILESNRRKYLAESRRIRTAPLKLASGPPALITYQEGRRPLKNVLDGIKEESEPDNDKSHSEVVGK